MNTDLSGLNLSFVHIGKSGGTTIHHLLKENKIDFKEYHMVVKNYNSNEKYIIWLRNPISRFVSAFNFFIISKKQYYEIKNKKITDFSLKNCILPEQIRYRLNRGFLFPKRFEELIDFFKNANNLAESLSSSKLDIKKKAMEMMNFDNDFNGNHFLYGIGWALNNGNFVKNRNNRILFVGKQETMKEDIERLGKILNVNLNSNKKVRENIYVSEESKYLSPLAIKNIIEWYKNTDYKALEELQKHGWITQESLDSYYKY
jgi:hypothetical protein